MFPNELYNEFTAFAPTLFDSDNETKELFPSEL